MLNFRRKKHFPISVKNAIIKGKWEEEHEKAGTSKIRW